MSNGLAVQSIGRAGNVRCTSLERPLMSDRGVSEGSLAAVREYDRGRPNKGALAAVPEFPPFRTFVVAIRIAPEAHGKRMRFTPDHLMAL